MEKITTLQTLLTGLTYLLTVPAAMYIWVHVILNGLKLNPGKPLGCVSCMSFWVYFFVTLFVCPECIIFAPTAYIIGSLLDRYVI